MGVEELSIDIRLIREKLQDHDRRFEDLEKNVHSRNQGIIDQLARTEQRHMQLMAESEARTKAEMVAMENRTTGQLSSVASAVTTMSDVVTEHMRREERLRWKLATFVIVSLGAGCIGMVVYIFQNMAVNP